MSPLKPQQVDRGETMVAAAAQSASTAALLREEAARIAAERQLVQRMNEMAARVAVLEQVVGRLTTCAVQQHWDGRLYVPAPERFALEFRIENTPFVGKLVTPPVMLEPPVSTPWPLPQQPVDVAMPRPQQAPTQQGSSLSQMAPSAGNWQSAAAGNAIDNPRSLGSGVPLRTR